MEILSRLVSKQVSSFITSFLYGSCFILTFNQWVVTDMEIPKVVGRIFEMCTLDKASIFWGAASGACFPI